MAESLRDLVVSLSLRTDNFTRNIKSVNKQIQEAESFFKLASAGVENFEQTTQGLSAHLSTLQQKLSLQREVVDQYQKALEAARAKLQECYDRQNQTSTVNLSIGNMSIRDQQDIQSLAIEIAALTKRRQVGKGMRTG